MSNGAILIMSLIAFGGSWFVKRWLASTYKTWSQVPNTYGVTGAQTAAAILRKKGVSNVKIERVRGKLTDHFDPARDILRLSQSNYDSTSVAAMAVSAHEAGFILGSDLLLRLGAWLLVGTLVFQLLTLPVEFNASKRALSNLQELGLTDPEQVKGTRRVLTAAALTYVAAAATSVAYIATLWMMTQGRRGI
jgi:Zn-dependent membrane protease YugP